MARRVLITGGAGFIGSHTADRLIADGHHVRVLDNLTHTVHRNGIPAYLHPDIEFIEGDVRDRTALHRAMTGVDTVIHLAAYQDYLPDLSTFFHVNAVSTALIYELIVEHSLPIEKVLIASSQFVQGEGLYRTESGEIRSPQFRPREQLEQGKWEHCDEEGRPMTWVATPETFASPPNAYALSKYSQEQQGLVFGRRYDIPTTVLRYSIVQGSRQSFFNAYSGACRLFSLHYYFGRRPTIFEDGRQVRDFVNIHDVVDANVMALEDERTSGRVFCVGGGRAYSITEFDRIVAKEFGAEDLEPDLPGLFRFGDTRHAVSDISALRSLGWEPRRDAVASVKEYAEYLRARVDVEDILAAAELTMRNVNVIGTVVSNNR